MTIERFREIEESIKGIIANAFTKAIQVNSSDFILLMARGGYHKHLDRRGLDLSPFVIDDKEDLLRDRTRRKFFLGFLNEYVEKLNSKTTLSKEDREYEVNIQLMVYAHIWESHLFLNQLSRLALIQLSKGYQWKNKIPHDGKANFINDSIIKRYELCDENMAKLIKHCYLQDYRNAFAHSSYYIEDNRIQLNKYALYIGPSMDFEEWDEVFVCSMLLSYHINDMLLKMKNRYIDEYGDGPVVIDLPMKYHHNKRKGVYIKPERIDCKEEKVKFRFMLKEELE